MKTPLNCQRSCASARHGGTRSSPPLSFQHSDNQKAYQGWSKCTYWIDWLIPENVRWEKVLGLFVPRWLTYSTGSLPILNCHHLSSVFFWPSLIHKSSWGQHPILYFLFIIDIHLRTISTCSMALKTSPVSKCRRSEIILSDQVLLTLWLTW